MNYPSLVPERYCTTKVSVVIEKEGISEDGAPLSAFTGDLKCNYQDVGTATYDSEKKIVKVTGKALFHGDICPDIETISSGSVTVHGVSRGIATGRKARNPDGTVNYTELMLI